jgi:hypothetical protein
LQAFWPLQDEFAILHSLWPLQALTPVQRLVPCALALETIAPAANSAAAVATIVVFFMTVSLDGARRFGARSMR